MNKTDGEKQKVMMRTSVRWDDTIRKLATDLMRDPVNPLTREDIQALVDRNPDAYNALRPLVEG